eukprot:TRINITY_DN74992_c0_g1_i1.p1 TRINITY_DN74992_c0_g1~~TRINITY_DN74992_c0_g1_i1.p1  ORF type:complete len:414 (-),score=63.27 TRINITY_DN74992_c0_g1_i1:128-1369(-)
MRDTSLLDTQQQISMALEHPSRRRTSEKVHTAHLRDALESLKSKSANNKRALLEAGESGQRLLAQHADLRHRLAYVVNKVHVGCAKRASIERNSMNEFVFDKTEFGGSSSSSVNSRSSSRDDSNDASRFSSGQVDSSKRCGIIRQLRPRKAVRRSCQVELQTEIQRLRERNAGFEEAIEDSENAVSRLRPEAGRQTRKSSSRTTRLEQVHADEGHGTVPFQEGELRQLQVATARREKAFSRLLVERREELDAVRQQCTNAIDTMRSKHAIERARNEELRNAIHEQQALSDASADPLNAMIDELYHEVEEIHVRSRATLQALNEMREELASFEASVDVTSQWPEELCSISAKKHALQQVSSRRSSGRQSWLQRTLCVNENGRSATDGIADSDDTDGMSVIGIAGFAEAAIVPVR